MCSSGATFSFLSSTSKDDFNKRSVALIYHVFS